MVTMQKAFKIAVGYSDHSTGLAVPMAAVALGACVIEKHITIDRDLPGPDHPHALEIAEFKEMVRQIHHLELALGTGIKGPVEAEIPERGWARRGIYAATNIPEGAIISRDMLKIVRPCVNTLEPKNIDLIIGRVARKNIAAHEPVSREEI